LAQNIVALVFKVYFI